MTVEFIHQGKIQSFEVPDQEPPAIITRTSRACPKSPVWHFKLLFAYVDTARQVAHYDVLEAETD